MNPKTGEVLERAIIDDPNDVAAHAAYADWLNEQGDPRGEFIQVQLALEDASRTKEERQALKKREEELLKKHEEEWVGAWAEPYTYGESSDGPPSAPRVFGQNEAPEGRGQHPFPQRKFHFIRGILAEAAIGQLDLAAAQLFVESPETRLIRRLSIGGWAYEEEAAEEVEAEDDPDAAIFPAQFVLPHWPYFANLRKFQLGWTSDDTYGDFCEFQCHLRAPRVIELIKKMPRLEELYLFADSVPTVDLFQLKSLDHLRVLQIYHCWTYPLELLAKNPAMQRLTHLLLHPKASGDWGDAEAPYITRDGVRAVLQSPHLKNLTHLRLRLTDIGDEGCGDIIRSGILSRLKMLDLRHGAVTDAGALALAACPDLKKLETLDLSRNRLTDAGINALRNVVPVVQTDFQQVPDEIGRGDYLFQGDYE